MGVLVKGLGLVEEVGVGTERNQPFVHSWADVLEHTGWVVGLVVNIGWGVSLLGEHPVLL